MEGHSQDSKFVRHRVAAQDLDGYNQGIAHEIAVHGAVKDVHDAIVGSARHEGVPFVKLARPDGSFVIFERLVRGRGQIQIEPHHSSIQRPHNQMISGRVYVQRRDPSTSRGQLFDHVLLDEVVHSHVLLIRHKSAK